MIKTIGVLTSGGDAPGMNAAVRAVVRAALKKGMTVYGVKRGYCGLLEDDIEPMDEMSVAGIISRGGTMLYTARSAEFRTEQGVLKAKATCEKYGLEGLVVIGGDGSFRGAADLSAHGILCVGLPGTIDNDIACTDYTIGYDTAMNTAMELMDKLSDTSQSHYRCSVVEVMGRGAGYIALNTGVASGALEIITKEKPYDLDKIAKKMMEFLYRCCRKHRSFRRDLQADPGKDWYRIPCDHFGSRTAWWFSDSSRPCSSNRNGLLCCRTAGTGHR